MMQQDWHPADIIAALKSRERRYLPFPATQGWRPPRWQAPLIAAGPKAKD
ncbi:Uncharacterised protein [Salmonella enterica subsp. arizonae]|nr:Uncharacterised protein [Salmonella enterica subsp. arizonae]